ncbi:MAG: hypothetical protein AAGC99_04180 [Pseudomonadota bacterium]
MTDKATIDSEQVRKGPISGSAMQHRGRCISMLRAALSGTRLFSRVVRSLSRQVGKYVSHQQTFISSLLLKPTQALMLSGIRCAGAGGGGPGH